VQWNTLSRGAYEFVVSLHMLSEPNPVPRAEFDIPIETFMQYLGY
jgi:hypothetical protein